MRRKETESKRIEELPVEALCSVTGGDWGATCFLVGCAVGIGGYFEDARLRRKLASDTAKPVTVMKR